MQKLPDKREKGNNSSKNTHYLSKFFPTFYYYYFTFHKHLAYVYLAWQDANFLKDVSFGIKVGANLNLKKPREEERATKMIDELPDLIGTYRDEALVAAVLAVFLLEDDAGHPAGPALFDGGVGARNRPWNGENGLVVLWVWPGEPFQVTQ